MTAPSARFLFDSSQNHVLPVTRILRAAKLSGVDRRSRMNEREELIDELTLVLLYLTSFTDEKEPGKQCAWKGHDWEALDQLVKDGFLEPPKCMRTHRRYLTNEGIEKAKEVLNRIAPSLGFSDKRNEPDGS